MPGGKTKVKEPKVELVKSGDGELVEPTGPVTDEVVEEVYQGIMALQRDATIELAVSMGKLIVDTFYGGKLDAWREHGNKETSLRKLADRFEQDGDATGLSAAAIFRVVAIYEMDRRLHVSSRKQLTVTHVRAVIGLPPQEQKRLLDEAEENGWTTRKLEEQVSGVRKKVSDGRGRPPLPAFVKTTNLLGKLAAKEDAFGDLELVGGMEKEDVEKTLGHVSALEERLQALKSALHARLDAAAGK